MKLISILKGIRVGDVGFDMPAMARTRSVMFVTAALLALMCFNIYKDVSLGERRKLLKWPSIAQVFVMPLVCSRIVGHASILSGCQP